MAGEMIYWNGTAAVTNTAGSSGQACISGGTGAPTFGTLSVGGGGTGLTTLTTAYGVVCAGTTATGALQNAGAGTSGQVLVSGGASALPSYKASGLQPVPISSVVASSPYVVTDASEYFIPVNTGAARTIQLPNSPAAGAGRVFIVKDATGTASSFNISVTTPGGTVTIDGNTTYTMATDFQALQFIFDGTNYYVF